MSRIVVPSARIASAPRWRVRDVKCSLSFDGVDDTVVGVAPGIAGSSVWTLAAWVLWRKDSSAGGWPTGVVSIGVASANTGAFIGLRSSGGKGHLSAGVYNDYSLGGDPVALGIWKRVIAVYSGGAGTITLYVGGVQNGAPLAKTCNITDTTPTLGALCGASSTFSAVLLDDARIYSRAWSPAEVAADFRGEDVSSTGLVRWWKLEDGLGSTAREEIGGTNDPAPGALWSPLVPFRRNRIVENVAACPYRAEVVVLHHADLSPGAGSFGIGGWIVAPPKGTALNLAFKYSASAYMFLDVPTDGLTRMRLYDGTTLITCASPFGAKPLTWMHLFGVRDNVSGLAILYVDGVPMKAQALGALGDIGNTANLTLLNPAAVLFGANDLLWRKGAPFTWDEIRAHYFDGIIPANPGGGVVQIGWAMREGAGTTVASSPAGYNGTLSAASWTTATRCKARIAVP